MQALIGRLQEEVRRHGEEIIGHYRHLHRHPELSWQEVESSRYIREKLMTWGIELQELGLKSGVVGILRGKGEGPCVALRADMDALPIAEETGCPHPSKHPGVMHACGHDSHMAALLGAARALAELRDELAGSVKFIFQPAEEIFGGAAAMLERGVLEAPKVDAIFGLHCSPALPTGTVAVKRGTIMAAANSFAIRIGGRGGHGGVPHLARDPVVCAAAVIGALQTVVSRLTDAQDTLVLSVCSIQGGEAERFNIIPDEVRMTGTVRALDPALCQMAEQSMRRVVEQTALAYGCRGELKYHYDLMPTINSDRLYPVALNAVNRLGGLTAADPKASTGGEDFSVFAAAIPGFYYWLGTGSPEKGSDIPWHNAKFRVDEAALPLGAQIYAASALEYLHARSGEDTLL